jgi:DNA-directed RNA polymerase specialized sigma24 family protein
VSGSDPNRTSDSGWFATTSWTVVLQARDQGSLEAQQALAELCRTYWYPLYAFLRRRGYLPDQAEDLTQRFFADLLSKDSFKTVDPAQGRFRTFLLASLEQFLANRRTWARRVKRGGTVPHVSIDLRGAEGRYLREPVHEVTPEQLFERRWTLTLLDHVLDRLEREMILKGKGGLFERLKPALMGVHDEATYALVGKDLGKTESAIRVDACRLRKRFRRLIYEEIGRTVADPDQLDDEINALFLAIGS